MEERKDNSLQYIKVRTRGDSDPNGKRRVYFTCHPKDFGLYFDKVCEDIFKTQDCAIYYTENMEASIPEKYLESDLGQINLLVIVVTRRLLTGPNRAMDFDFVFMTDEKHSTPVLPIVMETNIDNDLIEKYKKKFGKRQYLSPNVHDLSAINYEEKLTRYLSCILLDNDTVEKVRRAFDAYIFLSYRKKDRDQANELMNLIHKNPMYRDVAIWYDEFLTPGEDFENNIRQALDKSDLFALLVTPNLINEENYIRTTEYPYAHNNAQKRILPAEMVETDKEELRKQYPGVPNCVNARTDDLSAAILDGLKTISLRANEDDPEHCYLIGLAYLDGIDVEKNIEYAIQMLTIAANGGITEAKIKLYNIFSEIQGENRNNEKALDLARQLFDEYEEIHTENQAIYDAMSRFMAMTASFEEVDEIKEQSYIEQHKKMVVQNHRIYLNLMNNLAISLGRVGETEKELELCKKSYELHKEFLGETDTDTLIALQNLAFAYEDMNDGDTAFELYGKCYELSLKDLDNTHDEAYSVSGKLIERYIAVGKIDKAVELSEAAARMQIKFYGENSIQSLNALMNVETMYEMSRQYMKAFMISERISNVYNKVHGITLNNIDHIDREWVKVSDLTIDTLKKARKDEKRKYRSLKFFDDANNSGRIKALSHLAYLCEYIEDYKKELKYFKKILHLQEKAENPDINKMGSTIRDIILTCDRLGREKEMQKYKNYLAKIQLG